MRLDKVVVYNEQLEKRRFALLDAAHALEDVTEFVVESLVAVVAAVFFHPVTVCHVHRTRTPAGPKDLFERFAERT